MTEWQSNAPLAIPGDLPYSFTPIMTAGAAT